MVDRRDFVAIVAALVAVGCTPEPFVGTDVSRAAYGGDLRLTDHTGRPRTLADFRGKVVVLFFGYTQCPDVCPTALAEAAQAVRSLGERADRVQVLFVTVDPERDTAELLAAYVPAFHPDFLGLRGDADQTQAATQAFRVFHRRQAGKTPESYTVDHSAGTLVLDRLGRPRLYFGHGRGWQALAHDLRLLVDGR